MKSLIIVLLFVATLHADPREEIYSTIEGGFVETLLPTGSMRPAITENDYIVVKKLKWCDIRIGDVIVYKVHETHLGGLVFDQVCHRVYRKSSGGTVIECKGDANDFIDKEITEDSYIGTVVSVVRRNL